MALSPLAVAQTPIVSEVHTIAAATTGVPVEHDFQIANAGSYTITLTDLGAALTPSAPLASVKLAVTSGDKLVGNALVGAGTLTLSSLAAGTYTLHVVGMPGNVAGSGPIGITIQTAGNTQVASFSDVIALPNQALPNGEGVLNDSFMVSTSGTYTVSLNDLKLPASLPTLTLLLIAQGSSTPLAILPSSGAYQASVALTSGTTYRVFAVGQASGTPNAGLFSATVVDGSGAVAYGRAVPVGGVLALGGPTLAAGTYTFALNDLQFPTAFTQIGAAMLLSGQPVAQLSSPGSQSFGAASGTYAAYAYGTPAAGSAGAFGVQVTAQGSSSPTFGVARGVVDPASSLTPFAFDTNVGAAGAQTVTLTDFQFPAVLSNVSLAAVQNGALLGTPITRATTLDITPAAGPLSFVVFAQGASGGGLFGVTMAAGSSSPGFEVTQAVGTLFSAKTFAIAATGAYSVTATDLGFPANFTNYDTIVTQGSQILGSIYGGGTFNFTATATGTYYLNFIAQPGGTDEAGTYGLTVTTAPAAPTVTLSADHSSVNSGGTVDLVWSSTNATTCTASGGWSGTQPVSGTFTSAALTSDTTFTLTCTGAGGKAAQSVSVSVTSGGGGGGGGSLDLLGLLGLALAIGLRGAARARA
ncbi:MAG: hypothetical protein JSS29_12135 [Proteobacteria bacterium]|nr:hypothetical protein [Pseudomonadota bacterium]